MHLFLTPLGCFTLRLVVVVWFLLGRENFATFRDLSRPFVTSTLTENHDLGEKTFQI